MSRSLLLHRQTETVWPKMVSVSRLMSCLVNRRRQSLKMEQFVSLWRMTHLKLLHRPKFHLPLSSRNSHIVNIFIMHRVFFLFISLLLPLLSFIVSVHAWDYTELLQQELENEGLTELANVVSTINQTSTGQDLLSQISQGNYTFFAPTNEASMFADICFIMFDCWSGCL